MLRLIAHGQRDVDVARHLKITSRTVRFHVSNLAAKLGANGRVDLVRRAWEKGWIRRETTWESESAGQ